MGILIRLLGIVYSVASKKLASRLLKLGGKEIKSTKSKIKTITESGIKGLEKKTVGVKTPGAKTIAKNKNIPVRFKKTILGTEGRISLKPTPGEKVADKIFKNSRLRGQQNLKVTAAAIGGAAVISMPLIKKLRDQREKSKDKDERRKLTKLIDEGLLKIKQDEVDAVKLKNKKGVKKSIRPTARKFKWLLTTALV